MSQTSAPRLQRWINASFGLGPADFWLVANRQGVVTNAELVRVFQGIGRHDVELVFESETTDANFKAQSAAPITLSHAQISQPDRHLYQSVLWVLAAYEFVRTLDQICRSSSSPFDSAQNNQVNELKKRLERPRIPLAKLEQADRHPGDFPIAYPVWSHSKGAAWQVDSTTIIARIDLSDELLSLVEALRASK
jgi:hypothetical protein